MFRSWILALSFLAGALFGKPLATNGFFLCAKAYCFFHYGWSPSCQSLDWQKGQMIVYGLKAPFFFAQELRCTPWDRHIEVLQPSIAIEAFEAMIQSSAPSGFSWTLSMKEGSFQGEKTLDGAVFSYEKSWPYHLGHLTLERGDTVCHLEATEEGDKIQLEVQMSHFSADLLQRWCDLRGIFEGRVYLVFHGKTCQRGSAQIAFSDLAYAENIEGAKGTLDWEGVLDDPLKEGHARLVFEEGSLKRSEGKISDVKGEFSFTAKVGAKWEFSGIGSVQTQAIPWVWTGKAFLHDLRSHWIESEISSHSASIYLQGTKEEKGYFWKWQANSIGIEEGMALQSLYSLFSEPRKALVFDRGHLDAQGEILFLDSGAKEWSFLAHLTELSCRDHTSFLACDSMKAALSSEESGTFSISNASFETKAFSGFPLKMEGIHAVGEIFQNQLVASRFEGMVEKAPLEGTLSGSLENFTLEAFFQGAKIALSGQCRENWFLQAKGELASGIQFSCPLIEKRGAAICFDTRIDKDLIELARFYGTLEEGLCVLDRHRSHVLGSFIEAGDGFWDEQGLLAIHGQVGLSWATFLAVLPRWIPEAAQWVSLPMEGSALFDFSFDRGDGAKLFVEGQDLTFNKKPLGLEALALKTQEGWRIADVSAGGWVFSGSLLPEKNLIRIQNGSLAGPGLDVLFEGVLNSSLFFDLYCSHLALDLKKSFSLLQKIGAPIGGLEGLLKGSGRIVREQQWQADFCFQSESLKAASMDWHISNLIEVHGNSESGLTCKGLDLYAQNGDAPLFFCRVEKTQFQKDESLWGFYGTRLHIPRAFSKLTSYFDSDSALEFIADIECPSDFSFFRATIPKIGLALGGVEHWVHDVSLYVGNTEARTRLRALYQGRPIWINAKIACGADLSGCFSFEEVGGAILASRPPLSLTWVSSKGSDFRLRSIEGQFSGIDASFHALEEGHTLIGSARIHFQQIAPFLPQRIQTLIRDLSLGKGYEIKGKLSVDEGNPSFCGLLTGKQINLFGFQFRTLLSQIFLDAENFRLWDLKISDSAGIMKIDELIAKGQGDYPWTLSVPLLTLLELRPSLLQSEGAEDSLSVKDAGPLVVREMKLENLEGLLEETDTYTAHGNLEFINSYRREHTIFDIPSDLLGRIIGLDLELLTPACGKIDFDLKEGLFHLTALEDSFSEARRSEFFLVLDPRPTMDLGGNLHIFVAMKQFVLFKFTELFQIRIDGTLRDPRFHLQKKRRFLG